MFSLSFCNQSTKPESESLNLKVTRHLQLALTCGGHNLFLSSQFLLLIDQMSILRVNNGLHASYRCHRHATCCHLLQPLTHP